MVGLPLDRLLERLQNRSQACVTTLYDAAGHAGATTQIVVGNAPVPAIPADVLAHLRTAPASPEPLHVQSVVALNGRDYQFAYSPLRVRRAMSGFFAVALPREFIVDTWAQERVPLVLLALLLVAAVVGVGVAVSRYITRPLQDLVATARAVTNGQLRRRSDVVSRDELGVVARSFNQMTERLLHLYETSRNLSAHTHIGAMLNQTSAALPLRPLLLPPVIAEICGMPLLLQGRHIGVLLLLHAHRGAFPAAAMEPLVTIVSRAATALHNARLDHEVQEEGNRRRAILESIADGVVVCDAERNVMLMNPAAEALLDVRDWAEQRYHFDTLPLIPLRDPNALLAVDEPIQLHYEAHGRVLRIELISGSGTYGHNRNDTAAPYCNYGGSEACPTIPNWDSMEPGTYRLSATGNAPDKPSVTVSVTFTKL